MEGERPNIVQLTWNEWNHPPTAAYYSGGGRATLEFSVPTAEIFQLRIDLPNSDGENVAIYRLAFRSFTGTETNIPLAAIATWTFVNITHPIESNGALRFRTTSKYPHLYGATKLSSGLWLDAFIGGVFSRLRLKDLQIIALGALVALVLSIRRFRSTTSPSLSLMRDRTIGSVALLGLCVYSGVFSVLAGQDINGDQFAYQAYIPYAAVTGRTATDIAAGGVASFNNPLMYIPFFYGIMSFPPKVVGFLIGAFQGLNLVAVALIAWALAKNSEPTSRFLCAMFAVGLADTMPFHELELGRTIGDNWMSVPILFGFLLVLKGLTGTSLLLLSGGALLGFGAGLKLTGLSSCIGLGMACALVIRNLSRIVLLYLALLGGFLLAAGYWFAVMWDQWRNPVFPFLNAIFRSPWLESVNWQDHRWTLRSFGEFSKLPWSFAFDSSRFNEGEFTDYRWMVLFFLLAVLGAYRVYKRPTEAFSAQLSVTIWFVIFGFVVWALQFHYARYLMSIEYVAQALLAFLLIRLPASIKIRSTAATAVVAFLMFTSSLSGSPSWARQPWGQRWYIVENLDLPARSVVLLGNSMAGLLIDQPRNDAQYIGLGSNMSNILSESDENQPLRRRIQASIKRATDRIYYVELLSLPRPEAHLHVIFRQLGLTFGPCRLIKSNIADIKLCKVESYGSS